MFSDPGLQGRLLDEGHESRQQFEFQLTQVIRDDRSAIPELPGGLVWRYPIIGNQHGGRGFREHVQHTRPEAVLSCLRLRFRPQTVEVEGQQLWTIIPA